MKLLSTYLYHYAENTFFGQLHSRSVCEAWPTSKSLFHADIPGDQVIRTRAKTSAFLHVSFFAFLYFPSFRSMRAPLVWGIFTVSKWKHHANRVSTDGGNTKPSCVKLGWATQSAFSPHRNENKGSRSTIAANESWNDADIKMISLLETFAANAHWLSLSRQEWWHWPKTSFTVNLKQFDWLVLVVVTSGFPADVVLFLDVYVWSKHFDEPPRHLYLHLLPLNSLGDKIETNRLLRKCPAVFRLAR